MTLATRTTAGSPREGATPWWAAGWKWLARPAHHRPVHNLRLAVESRDAARLATLLSRDVAVVVDSGNQVQPTLRVIRGVQDATTLLLHGMDRRSGLRIAELPVNGQAGLTLSRGDEVTALMTVDFAGGRVSAVWIRLRPEMLRHWNSV